MTLKQCPKIDVFKINDNILYNHTIFTIIIKNKHPRSISLAPSKSINSARILLYNNLHQNMQLLVFDIYMSLLIYTIFEKIIHIKKINSKKLKKNKISPLIEKINEQRQNYNNSFLKSIVSFKSGPVEIIVTGTPVSVWISSMNCLVSADKSP